MRAANHRQSGTCGKRARNSSSPAADSDFTDDPTATASGSCQLGLRAAAGRRRVQVLHSSFCRLRPSPRRPQALESTLSKPITGIFCRGHSVTPKLAALGAGRGHPGPRPRPRPRPSPRPPGDGDGTPVPDLPGDGDWAPSPICRGRGRSPVPGSDRGSAPCLGVAGTVPGRQWDSDSDSVY